MKTEEERMDDLGHEPEVKDESDAICPCGEPDCSRPFGHPEESDPRREGIYIPPVGGQSGRTIYGDFGPDSKPELRLVGEDGNAFAILGAAQRAARKAGWPKEMVEEMMNKAKSGDYDHLLQTMMEYFDVC